MLFSQLDWVFWAWVVVTILLFIDIIIPDPIPFIDEAILTILFFGGIAYMAGRSIMNGIDTIVQQVTHPAIIAFVVTMAALVIFGKIKNTIPKRRRK